MNGADSVRALDRALDIPSAFSRVNHQLSALELAQRVDLSRPALYRNLQILEAEGGMNARTTEDPVELCHLGGRESAAVGRRAATRNHTRPWRARGGCRAASTSRPRRWRWRPSCAKSARQCPATAPATGRTRRSSSARTPAPRARRSSPAAARRPAAAVGAA
ncbi:MAG: helix-turn-helix domain-containing protein [Rubrivivax sp.]|nr:helix-turn-helix domain-containing protein [Rubrivivax sp.]